MAKILLVEDDAILSEMYHQKLKTEHFEVILADEGEKGLMLALTTHPDLLLLDLKLPKLDGMSVMKRLREDEWGKTVPIVILTNFDPDDAMLQGVIRDQPSFYLIKSNLSPNEVIEKIKEVLKAKETITESQ